MTWWRDYTKKRLDKEKREIAPRGRARDLFFEDPWSAFERMHSEMDDLFSSVFSSMPEAVRFREPLADIKETETEITAVVELPGVKKEDIKLHIEGDILAIEAASETRREEEKEGFYRQERGYSSFRRAFSLPSEVVPERSKASFSNGILKVVLPKRFSDKGGAFSLNVD